MEVSFADDYLLALYQGNPTGKPKFQGSVVKKFRQRINTLKTISNTEELKQFKSLNFEALIGDKKGFHSIRVDRKYRLIITVADSELKIGKVSEEKIIIEELSNHYQ